MYNYTKRIRLARLKVGIVITIGIFVLIIGLLFAGGIGDLFAGKSVIHAVFKNVQGLRPGAPVRFGGMEIGRVTEMRFDPTSRIRVSLSIRTDVLQYLRTDSQAQLLTLGLLGDKYVALSPGSPQGDPLQEGDTLQGELERGLGEVVQTTEQVIGRIDILIQEVEKIFSQLHIEKGTLAKLLSDPRLYDDVRASIQSLNALLEKVNAGQGSLGMLITDPELYQQLSAAARRIESFAAELSENRGSLRRFIEDPALYENLLETSRHMAEIFRGIDDGGGSLVKLIQDDRLYDNLESLTASLDRVLARVDAGQGILGNLVHDELFVQELRNTIRELNTLVQDIRANPRKYFDFSLF
jgi:phospholipid/cholesterol/gamma-HCH transport system substrate-binding protein